MGSCNMCWFWVGGLWLGCCCLFVLGFVIMGFWVWVGFGFEFRGGVSRLGWFCCCFGCMDCGFGWFG